MISEYCPMVTIHHIDLIRSDPQIRNGQPCIAGTGVRVADVVIVMKFHRKNADEIAAWFDVPLAGVHAALAYYYEHQAELDEAIRQQIDKAHKLKEQHLANGDNQVLP